MKSWCYSESFSRKVIPALRTALEQSFSLIPLQYTARVGKRPVRTLANDVRAAMHWLRDHGQPEFHAQLSVHYAQDAVMILRKGAPLPARDANGKLIWQPKAIPKPAPEPPTPGSK